MAPSKRRKGKHSSRSAISLPTAARQQGGKAAEGVNEEPGDATALATGESSGSASPPATTDTSDGADAAPNTQEETPIQTEIITLEDENDLILTSSKRRGVYECDYCHNDISQSPRIRCAVCEDFDLCLDCFTANLGNNPSALSSDSEAGTAAGPPPHNPTTHGYRVCDSTRFPIFPTAKNWSSWMAKTAQNTTGSSATDVAAAPIATVNAATPKHDDAMDIDEPTENEVPGAAAAPITATNLTEGWNFKADDPKMYWTVEEDLRLLEGIQNHGLGNWVEIAETVSGQGSVGKTPKRCMERYLDDYLGRYGHILPPYALVPEDMIDGGSDAAAGATTPNPTSTNSTMDTAEASKTGSTETELTAGTPASPIGATTPGATATTPSEKETAEMPKATTESAGDSSVGTSRSSTPAPSMTAAEAASEAAAVALAATEMPRASKRRAALLRTPVNSNSSHNYNSTLASRKKYKVVPTESLPGYESIWQHQYVPTFQGDQHPLVGQDVGRDQASKAEQNYVKLITAAQTKQEVEKIRKEWVETKLHKTGGPTVLPPRPEDSMELSGAELAGFMPRRGDFDVEYENDAEEAIGDMEFLPGDSEEDKQVKLKVLAIYNAKLDKRESRKNFIISRKLWDYRKLHQDNEKLPRDERDLVHRMRLFERFHTPQEHKVFLDDILKAKRLRKEIAKLQMYRRMGIRTLAEAEKYELDKARRNFHKLASANQKAQEKQQPKSTGTEQAGAVSNGVGAKDPSTPSTNAGVKTGDGARKPSTKPDDTTTSTSLWKQYRTSDRRVRKSVNRGSSGLEEDAIAAGSSSSLSGKDDPMDIDGQPGSANTGKGPAAAQSGNSPSKQPNRSTRHAGPPKPPPPSLSVREIELCEKVGLSFSQYREIKKVLIQESLDAGLLDKEGAGSSRRALIKMDVERRGNLVDFFLRAGWVSTRLSHIARSLPQSQQQS